MAVLYGIGMVLRFVLKVALLPVQAVLTLFNAGNWFYWWLSISCI